MKKGHTPSDNNEVISEIPEIEFIDLENPADSEDLLNMDNSSFIKEANTDASIEDSFASAENLDENTFADQDRPKSKNPILAKLPPFMNFHFFFALIAIVIIVSLYFSIKNWGVMVDLNEIFKNGKGEYSDTMDSFLPLIPVVENNPADDGVTNIVCFGNAPFADDRDSKDNLANIIAQKANANVYNCSISGSHLAAIGEFYYSDVAPIDAYNLYWLTTLAIGGPVERFFPESAAALGESTPPEAEEVFNTLTTLDFNTVDVIAIMYDASDYLAGLPMYDDANNTHITGFTGNMEASIELFRQYYPHIRFIVMSPTYAFAIDEEGEYISSDIMTYGWDVLSTYVIKQADSSSYQSVSFIDNLYGTITEDNASDYLLDHLHLNVEGRKKVADRFVDCLQYYDD